MNAEDDYCKKKPTSNLEPPKKRQKVEEIEALKIEEPKKKEEPTFNDALEAIKRMNGKYITIILHF